MHKNNMLGNNYIAELLETEEQENIMSEEDYDLLCSLEMQPIDLNKATREDLEQLPFLSPTQIEDILAYILSVSWNAFSG